MRVDVAGTHRNVRLDQKHPQRGKIRKSGQDLADALGEHCSFLETKRNIRTKRYTEVTELSERQTETTQLVDADQRSGTV